MLKMDCLKDVNEKYANLEADVNRKLEQIKNDESKITKTFARAQSEKNKSTKSLSYDEALKRNASLLKSLEMAKARLRSRSAFSPVEQILKKALENYKRDVLGTELTTTTTTTAIEEINKLEIDKKQTEFD